MMGFRATGNDQMLAALTPAHRRAIIDAGESVADGSLCYWAPSFRAREVAEAVGLGYRAGDNSLLIVLTKIGRHIREGLL